MREHVKSFDFMTKESHFKGFCAQDGKLEAEVEPAAILELVRVRESWKHFILLNSIVFVQSLCFHGR